MSEKYAGYRVNNPTEVLKKWKDNAFDAYPCFIALPIDLNGFLNDWNYEILFCRIILFYCM